MGSSPSGRMTQRAHVATRSHQTLCAHKFFHMNELGAIKRPRGGCVAKQYVFEATDAEGHMQGLHRSTILRTHVGRTLRHPHRNAPSPTPSCGSKQEAPSTHPNSSSRSSVSIARGVASPMVLRWDRGACGESSRAVRWTASRRAWETVF